MQPLAHFALTASIVTSALGALVLCAVVVRYGLPSSADTSDDGSRRVFLTRLGHVAGAVCFSITAGLAIVALSVQSRAAMPVVSAPAPPPPPSVAAADVERLASATTALERDEAETRNQMLAMGTRLRTLEASLERVTRDQTAAAVKLDQLDRVARAAAASRDAARAVRETRSAPPPTTAPVAISAPPVAVRVPVRDDAMRPAAPGAMFSPMGDELPAAHLSPRGAAPQPVAPSSVWSRGVEAAMANADATDSTPPPPAVLAAPMNEQPIMRQLGNDLRRALGRLTLQLRQFLD